ncbi:MAG: TetR/AcrR family transcriptional regulator [Hyphomicrobiaceae bacterium]|nr:TetR/AcrR family transcriptional regulator [Hyphomicrobiaceae bacterium]
MGRTRVIDREAVLCAAERVVSREGAARLTLEAVAAEAGISKASVLYDYKTKQALIRAVIERRVSAENARLGEAIDRLGPVPDRVIRGRIAAASRSVSDADRAVALNLAAALAQDTELRAPIQEAYRHQIAEILEKSSHPRGALLAFLALEGLKLLECLGLCSWPEDERKRLLEEIASLADRVPTVLPGEDRQR